MSAWSADIAGTENTPRAVATAAATRVWRARPARPSVEGCKGLRVGVIVNFPIVLFDENVRSTNATESCAEQRRVCATATKSRKRLAPHTVLQLCDSENAETLQIYYSVREAVVVF